MRPGVDPKVDYAFKRLFGSEDGHDVLIAALNGILQFAAGRQVVEVHLLNPFNDKMKWDDKLSIVDVKARDQSGRHFNVEMQLSAPPYYPQRAVYYWSRLYVEQLTEGRNFDQLRPTYSINFLNNERFDDDLYHHAFCLYDVTAGVTLTDDLSIHFIELPKFTLTPERLTNAREMWCYFLRHGEDLDSEHLPVPLDVPQVRRALEVLNVLTENEIERLRYQARLDAIRERSTYDQWEREQRAKIEEGQKAIEEGQKAIEEGQKAIEEGQKALEERQKALEEGRKVIEERQKALEEGRKVIEEGRKVIEERQKAAQEKEKAIEERQKAVEESRLKSEGIGRILVLQEMLGLPLTPREQLMDLSSDELANRAAELQQQLKARP